MLCTSNWFLNDWTLYCRITTFESVHWVGLVKVVASDYQYDDTRSDGKSRDELSHKDKPKYSKML